MGWGVGGGGGAVQRFLSVFCKSVGVVSLARNLDSSIFGFKLCMTHDSRVSLFYDIIFYDFE